MDYRDYQTGAGQDHFWFKAKTALITQLCSHIAGEKKLSILSVGAGTGEDLAYLASIGQVYAIDIDQQALDLIPAGLVIEKKCADARDIPYPDNTFDLVVAFDVLEHVEQDQQMVDELYRICKPGGSAILTVPAFNALFSGHDKALCHHRRYNKPMMRALFKKFKEQNLSYWFFFLFPLAACSRLISKKSSASSMSHMPSIINKLFYETLNFENWLIAKGVKFPFGLTLYAVYKK